MSTDEKSLNDLKRIARAGLQEAAKAEPCVTLTEKNWQAILRALGAQEQLLERLLAEQQELSTWEDLQGFLAEQRAWMERSDQAMVAYQSAMERTAEETVKALSAQAGKLNESSLSLHSRLERETKRLHRRLFWLSLIPSLMLLLLELTQRCWPLIFPA